MKYYLTALVFFLCSIVIQGKILTKISFVLPLQGSAYTGHFIEHELEGRKALYCMRAREYDPQLRRFLSPDKVKEQFGAYTYVANDPIKYIDVDGRMRFDANGRIYTKKNNEVGKWFYLGDKKKDGYSVTKTFYDNEVFNQMIYPKGSGYFNNNDIVLNIENIQVFLEDEATLLFDDEVKNKVREGKIAVACYERNSIDKATLLPNEDPIKIGELISTKGVFGSNLKVHVIGEEKIMKKNSFAREHVNLYKELCLKKFKGDGFFKKSGNILKYYQLPDDYHLLDIPKKRIKESTNNLPVYREYQKNQLLNLIESGQKPIPELNPKKVKIKKRKKDC